MILLFNMASPSLTSMIFNGLDSRNLSVPVQHNYLQMALYFNLNPRFIYCFILSEISDIPLLIFLFGGFDFRASYQDVYKYAGKIFIYVFRKYVCHLSLRNNLY